MTVRSTSSAQSGSVARNDAGANVMIFWRRRYLDLACNFNDGWIFLKHHHCDPFVQNLPVISLIRIVRKECFDISGDCGEIRIFSVRNASFIAIADHNIEVVILALMIDLEVLN